MKKLFTIISIGCALVAGKTAQAQSFTVQHDTVWITPTGSGITEAHSDITNITGSDITMEWKVIATDFPDDWVDNSGICDNASCYSGSLLWVNATSSGTAHEAIYTPSTLGTFKLQINLDGSTTTGTRYMRARVANKFPSVNDTAYVVFMVTKNPTSVGTVKAASEVSLYPNPASTSVNVVYEAAADIKNIAVYSIIGRQMAMYRANGNNSASMNVENMPAGIYFVRLLNSKGDIVATRKFTKQ
jgi:hypothetical protein